MPDLFGDTGGETVDLNGVPIHVGMLDRAAQQAMVRDLRAVAEAAPFRRYETPGGRQMSVAMTAAGALVHALQTIGVKRIGFASPYVPSLNDEAIAFLASEGFETVSRADVEGDLGNEGQGALTPEDVAELAHRANSAEAEAIVLSCTDMRSVEAIDRLETELGKPVITSNQAMMFQTAQLASLGKPPAGFGQLFDRIGS